MMGVRAATGAALHVKIKIEITKVITGIDMQVLQEAADSLSEEAAGCCNGSYGGCQYSPLQTMFKSKART